MTERPAQSAAVLWDMDGTLIDSEPSWIRAQERLVLEHGGRWTQADGERLIGADMAATVEALRSAGVQLPDLEIAAHLESAVAAEMQEKMPWRPGVLPLLRSVARLGWPCAIVTTSSAALATIVAKAAPGPGFRAVVTAESTSRSKPYPDPYLHAAALLGVPIAQCIAIEDSPTGLSAAVASGAICLAVPSLVELLVPQRGTRWTTLAGRTASDLQRLRDDHR